jgi:threonine dehydratase
MSLTIEKIRDARERIRPHILCTPLLRMSSLDPFLGCRVYVKAECMQTTGAFKLRGVMNKVLSLSAQELERGLVAASSGNHGMALAYAGWKLGVRVTVVLPDTAARVKAERIRTWGAETVCCEVSERFEVAQKLCRERGATLVPPYNDEEVMAGQGTLGLEMMEQCPELDALVVPVSGGGLLAGVATAARALASGIRVFGAEPAALPRYTASLRAGKPVTVESRRTIADALVSQRPGDLCFPCVAAQTDGVLDVGEGEILRGMKLLLMEGKLLCEPSSAVGIGAALAGLVPVLPRDRVCFVISGGNVALEQLQSLA